MSDKRSLRGSQQRKKDNPLSFGFGKRYKSRMDAMIESMSGGGRTKKRTKKKRQTATRPDN